MRKLLLCLLLLTVVAGASFAQGPAFTITNTTGTGGLGNPPFTLGWAFSVNSSVSVSSLCIFDDSQDGLVDSYPVGLWDSSGNLLTSTTVLSGTTDPLVNQFRCAATAPVILTAGQSYQIGALYLTGDDSIIFPGDAAGFATDPAITFTESRFAGGAALSNPTGSVSTDPAYFGPNMLISAAVPEPGTFASLAGMLAIGGLAIRRRRVA